MNAPAVGTRADHWRFKAFDYARLIDEARSALMKISKDNEKDEHIQDICTPLIEKLKIG